MGRISTNNIARAGCGWIAAAVNRAPRLLLVLLATITFSESSNSQTAKPIGSEKGDCSIADNGILKIVFQNIENGTDNLLFQSHLGLRRISGTESIFTNGYNILCSPFVEIKGAASGANRNDPPKIEDLFVTCHFLKAGLVNSFWLNEFVTDFWVEYEFFSRHRRVCRVEEIRSESDRCIFAVPGNLLIKIGSDGKWTAFQEMRENSGEGQIPFEKVVNDCKVTVKVADAIEVRANYLLDRSLIALLGESYKEQRFGGYPEVTFMIGEIRAAEPGSRLEELAAFASAAKGLENFYRELREERAEADLDTSVAQASEEFYREYMVVGVNALLFGIDSILEQKSSQSLQISKNVDDVIRNAKIMSKSNYRLASGAEKNARSIQDLLRSREFGALKSGNIELDQIAVLSQLRELTQRPEGGSDN